MFQLNVKMVKYYLRRPERMAQQQFGFEPDADQVALFRSVIVDHKPVAWRSGTGVGKTAAFAVLILMFLYLFPRARVVATSTKKEQLSDVLWPELLKWINRSKLKDDYVWHAESVHLRGREKQVFAVPRTGASPEAMQGVHEDYLLIVCDESSGIPDKTFEPLEGTLTGKVNVIVLGGNPTRASGYFFDAHHKHRAEYLCLHTSSEGHPRVDQVRHVARMERKWGRDSDMYRTRVLGEFPKGDPGALIPLELVLAAVGREGILPHGQLEVGVDVARFGDDRIVMVGRHGNYWSPRVPVYGKLAIPETVGYVIQACRGWRQEFGFRGAIRVKVDDTGVGGGVTDGLNLVAADEDLEVMPCNFGGEGTDEHDNWATWAWCQLKEQLPSTRLPLASECEQLEDLVGELTTRRFSMTPKGRIKLEPKADYKARHRFSPDLADAAVLCAASVSAAVGVLVSGSRLGLGSVERFSPAEAAWR